MKGRDHLVFGGNYRRDGIARLGRAPQPAQDLKDLRQSSGAGPRGTAGRGRRRMGPRV